MKKYKNTKKPVESLDSVRVKNEISNAKIYPSYQSMELTALQNNTNRNKKLEQEYFQDYKPGNYKKSIKFMNEHGYKRKLITGDYEQIQFLSSNHELKQFGIGIYLYLQFFRRIVWLFLIFCIFQGLPLYMNYSGTGLNQYSLSFGTFFITSSLGNYSTQVTQYDPYFQTGIHCAINLILFLFFLSWKVHNFSEIQNFQNDNNIVHPKKFCVEIQGLPKKGVTNRELQVFFSNFGPVYECSLVYNYKDKLKYFKDIDELDEQLKQEQLEIRLGDGDKKEYQQLKKKKSELAKQINQLKISPTILSAYIHFEFQKSKINLLDFYNDHYLFNSKLHELTRNLCCCCIDPIDDAYLFKGIQLKVKTQKVPDPSEINWESIDVTFIGKLFRILIAFLVIIIFLAICSTLVALCSIFIATNSINCNGVTIPANITSTNDTTVITCFCSSNLLNFDGNTNIQTICQQIFKKLYLSNGLQIGAALISSFTNFLFALLIDKIIDFTKPVSLSSALSTKTFILFIFFFINTCIIPLLLFANIFGFQISSYVSFIHLILPDSDYFNTSNLTYYEDFTNIWYRNVSPYFTNFLVINIIVIWVKFIYYNCSNRRRRSSLQSEQGKILQKNMNKQIISFQVSVVDQTAELLLIIFLSFMYNAGIPILIPLAFLNIASRYIINKYLILRFSTKINGLTENFNEVIINVLPFSIIISCLVGIWMLTASLSIYPKNLSVNIPGTQTWQTVFVLFPRLFYISFTLIMAIIVVVYIFLYNTIVRFMSWASGLCYSSKEASLANRKVIQFSQAAKTLNILSSYNIHSNDKYKNTIINLERYLEME